MTTTRLMAGSSALDALTLGSVYCLTFVSTRALLDPPVQYWRLWAEGVFYIAATVGGGLFFSWLTASILKLRAHEHRQNNTQHLLVLAADDARADLTAIRRALGIPRDDA